MIDKKELKKCARSLMFDMNEEDYEILQNELDLILKEIEVITNIDEIKNNEPMTFPFVTYKNQLREDIAAESLDIYDILKNTESSYLDQVKVPKVVE